MFTNSHLEVFLGKAVLKIYSKFTEQPCRRVISIKLQSNSIKITLRHGCSPVSLLHNFKIPFPKNTSGRLLLNAARKILLLNSMNTHLHFSTSSLILLHPTKANLKLTKKSLESDVNFLASSIRN